MIAKIANEIRINGYYTCYISVESEQGRFYFLQKSVPIEEETEENIEAWKIQAINLAIEYFNNFPF